jgi:predicted dienelactone hydrolase
MINAAPPRNLQSNPIGFSGLIKFALSGLSGLLSLVAIAPPAHAAERVYITYSVLGRSISVESLERYAKTGVTDDEDLAVYAQYAKPKELAELQKALQTKADIKPVTVAQFLNSPQGVTGLKRLGRVIQPQIIQPETKQPNSKDAEINLKAIRSALILASSDPEGLTLLNFLKKYPSQGIRIDLANSLSVFGEVQGLISKSQRITTAISRLATEETITDVPLAADLPDLRQPGQYRFQVQTLNLNDPTRTTDTTTPKPAQTSAVSLQGRAYAVDVYLPIVRNAAPRSLPVVVISHGLGSDRTSFSYLAKHLASHGFAVLAPDHPGSNAKQLEALFQGIASEVAEPSEFANRPLDISFLLTYLEQQSVTNLDFRSLNLNQVGVIGQSFGGYTALAIAGAPINFEKLRQECPKVDDTFNISLVLQCRAQQLEQTKQLRADFRDPRVAAIIAMNPIDSAVLGEPSISQITTPTMIIAGTADTVAPALFEQVQPFTWLTTNEKYLVQMEPGTHFSVIGTGEPTSSGGGVAFPSEVIGPNPAIAHRYINALALAFFKTYIAKQSAYRPYLSASYAARISDPALQLSLVRSLSANQVAQQ